MTRQVIVGKAINLDIKVYNALGVMVDASSIPYVEIKDSDNNIQRPSSPSGVQHLETGKYRLTYTVPVSAESGIWTDFWRLTVDGNLINDSFNFIVLTESASIEVVGAEIGDKPNFTYTQDEVECINILLDQLRYRLKDSTEIKSVTKDAYGADTLTECPIFSDNELHTFVRASLSEFNQIPHFTSFTFGDTIICDKFAHVIVEGSYILALAAQMLVAAGREFTVTDNGITMQPPPMSQTMNNSLSVFLTRHTETLKFIKTNMKPSPRGVGTFRVMAVSPAFLRLRHLRQRQII